MSPQVSSENAQLQGEITALQGRVNAVEVDKACNFGSHVNFVVCQGCLVDLFCSSLVHITDRAHHQPVFCKLC